MAEQIAIQQFPAQRDGHTVVVLAGARFPSTDPIVKAQPTMFEPVKRGTRAKAKAWRLDPARRLCEAQ